MFYPDLYPVKTMLPSLPSFVLSPFGKDSILELLNGTLDPVVIRVRAPNKDDRKGKRELKPEHS